jgi:hypothetical protein
MAGTNAFKVGYKAFKTGKLDCPFEENTYFAREWLRGFNTAYFNQLEWRERKLKSPKAA